MQYLLKGCMISFILNLTFKGENKNEPINTI